MTQKRTFPLIPLGIGEQLDRAIALVTGNFLPLLLVIGALVIPLAIVRYFGTPDWTALLRSIGTTAQHPGPGQAAEIQRIFASFSGQSTFALTALLFVSAIVFGPLAWAALINSLAAAYRGEKRTFVQTYREALRRWLPVVVVSVAFLGLGIIGLIAFALVMVILGLGLAGIAALTHSQIAGILAGLLIFLLAMLVMIVLGSWASLAYQFAIVGVVVEANNPVTAIAAGLRRTFSKGTRKRAIGIALALAAVTIGVTVLNQALVAGFAMLVVPRALIESLITGIDLVLRLVLTAFVVIAYFDIRVRREGLDLETTGAVPVVIAIDDSSDSIRW